MRRASRRPAFVAVVAIVALTSAPAAAHEEVRIAGLEAEVGWVSEPVIVGFPNGIFLSLVDESGQPLRDLGEGLKVEIVFGAERMPARAFDPLEEPGTYEAAVIPTRPGAYSVRLAGTILGKRVDQTVKIEDADEPADLMFPVKDPSLGQLAGSVDRLGPRVDNGLKDSRLAATQAKDAADQSRVVAVIALAVAVMALVLSIVRRRRPTFPPEAVS